MTGPPEPFDGFDGIKQRVTGPFDLEMPARPDALVIEQIHTKYRPAEYNAQGPLDLILRLREQIRIEDIERIDLETYWLAYSEIGMEPEKWNPQTRETADHSLPYLLAVALVDGDVRLDSFAETRIRDPRLRPLMDRIHIAENKDHSERFPAELPCRITIRLKDGREVADEIAYPKGHVHNPITDDDIDRKFDDLIRGKSEADTKVCQELRSALWTFDSVGEVSAVLEPLGALQMA